jgi:hypothetical protein
MWPGESAIGWARLVYMGRTHVRKRTITMTGYASLMRRAGSSHAFVVLVLALMLSGPWTLAKGVDRVAISGPGLPRPIEVTPVDERTSATFSLLKFYAAIDNVLIPELPGDLAAAPPAGDLGPKYMLTWYLPGGGPNDNTVVQDLYPYATAAPVLYTPPQANVVRTGWHFSADPLRDVLISVGLPPSARQPPSSVASQPPQPATPAGTDSTGLPVVVAATVAGIAVAALVGGAALIAARRRRLAVNPRSRR